MTRNPTMLALLMVLATAIAAPADAKDNKHCPPGLAKKEVPCVPPGQAKKSTGSTNRDHYHDDDRGDSHFWDVGDVIDGDYVLIPREDWIRWNLSDHRDGSRYVRIDNQILRVAQDTLTVLEAIRIAQRVIN